MAWPQSLTIGTRGSLLARTQAGIVSRLIRDRYPDISIETQIITTKGDLIIDRPIAAIGDTALFVTAIQEELRAGHIDLAIHSAKDLPTESSADMVIAALPARADARDAIVSRHGELNRLPLGARVGTSSARRTAQLRAARPDLMFADIRGNVDTRLGKLEANEYDAIVLAMAGLERIGRIDDRVNALAVDVMIPAPGQGALAIEVRESQAELATALSAITHIPTETAVRTERAFLRATGGGCNSPVAAYAEVAGRTLSLTACIAHRDGRVVRGTQTGAADDADAIALALAHDLLGRGGAALMRDTRRE